MVARISLAGYSTKEIQLTDGPIHWIGLNGRSHGEYWLLKAEHFHVDLQPISQVFTGGLTARLPASGTVDLQPELSLEELVRRTKPAVERVITEEEKGCAERKTGRASEGRPCRIGDSGRSLIARAAGASADLEDSAWPPMSWLTPELQLPKQAQTPCIWAR